jgi:hypothetical protein
VALFKLGVRPAKAKFVLQCKGACIETMNRQGDPKVDKIGSDLQNETPQKTEVQTSSSCGISFRIDTHRCKLHLPRLEGRLQLQPHVLGENRLF